MKSKDSGDNKGFAFVTFRNVDMASQAIKKLNNTEFKVILDFYLFSVSLE